MFDRSFIEDNLPPVIKVSVAHYTRIGNLRHFIPQEAKGWNSAWATPVQFLNDRQELLLGLKVLDEVANGATRATDKTRDTLVFLQASSGRLETDAFQMSFSGHPDELGQWRGYANDGMGCSVVTDALAVKNVADIAGWVLYDTDKQQTFARKVLRRLKSENDRLLIEQVLIAAASYMKHKGFEQEKEFRLLKFPGLEEVQFRESGDRLVPYVDVLAKVAPLPVSRIIIGPGWQLGGMSPEELNRNHVVQGVQRLLSARGMYGVDIASSEIPYDPK